MARGTTCTARRCRLRTRSGPGSTHPRTRLNHIGSSAVAAKRLAKVKEAAEILHSMLQLREDRCNLILELQTPLLEPCENLVVCSGSHRHFATYVRREFHRLSAPFSNIKLISIPGRRRWASKFRRRSSKSWPPPRACCLAV